MHKGQVLEVLADANHKHGAAKLARIDCRLYARLDAGALEGDAQAARESGNLFDVLSNVLGFDAALDEDSFDARNELLREVEARLSDIRDNDRSRSSGPCGEEADETDGAGSADRKEKGVRESGSPRPTEKISKLFLFPCAPDSYSPDQQRVSQA